MRGMLFGERLLVENLARLLGAGTLVTLGVVLVLGYGRKLERNGRSFSKKRLFLLKMVGGLAFGKMFGVARRRCAICSPPV